MIITMAPVSVSPTIIQQTISRTGWTTSNAGLVEKATNNEQVAGSSDALGTTPLGVKRYVDGRRASDAEARAGTNQSKLITPADLVTFRNARRNVDTDLPSSTELAAMANGDIWIVRKTTAETIT